MENINSWKDIQWSAVEATVFRLQLRIYKAAKEKQMEKVYKLQKTLLKKSSFAKYLAVRRVTQENQGKNTPGIDGKLIRTPLEKFQLASNLTVNGKTSPILRKYIPKPDGSLRPLGIPTMEDRAKQMLVYLALSPQWEAEFEAGSYGFRPGRSVLDAMEAVFLGISKKPKWVLDADISKCFDQINHKYLLEKCQTYPELRKQLRSWLKAGILDGKTYAFPEMGTPQGGVISPLLCNIALHGLKEALDERLSSLGYHRPITRQPLTFIRYADDFVLMHPDKEVITQLQESTQDFLKPIGLQLHPDKTRIIHTQTPFEGRPPGFTFLGFDVVQKTKWVNMRLAFTKKLTEQKFITLITPSKEGIKRHKQKLRDIIRRYRGVDQESIIQKLNPIIRGWALSKRTQISSKVFQSLDAYCYQQLWKWACKRHPKMSRMKLKQKYWQIVENRKWCFATKGKKDVLLQLQLHSKIPILRYAKVKGSISPFDGNLEYWTMQTGKNPLIPPIKAKLIKEQKGVCGICKKALLPTDLIERDHIVPKALGGLNRRDNVQAVHQYCHQEKTQADRIEIRRQRKTNLVLSIVSRSRMH